MSNTTTRLDDDAAKSLLAVLARVREGDFTARMPADWTGVAGKVADGLNDVIVANQMLEKELARVSRAVGTQGRLSQRASLDGWTRGWSGSVESVNNLIDSLVRPTIEMQRVIGAVASGDLSQQVSADVRGEMLDLKNTINGMVDQLNGFTSEVTRVAREVGTEGKLGQAAAVTIEVGGVWKDLTDNVNQMAGNLTGQVRNIAEVTTAVANGDLSKKISIDVKGEFLELKNTINAMVDQLNAFAGEVTRVAREVGVEGKLGGQAQTKEVGGVWKGLTDNVNQWAANLTSQVRAIAEVAAAVTEGDLTRQVQMEASGEVAALKDSLNEMIRNLRATTGQNIEQDWLKTNRERFTRMLQGHRDLDTVSNLILSELAPLVSAQHAVFYSMNQSTDRGEPVLRLQAGYGYEERRSLATTFRIGEGLVGQCAKEKKRILLTEVPGDYVRINSGLGAAPPLTVIVLPILYEGSVRAVVELASFSTFSEVHLAFLDQLTESIGLVLHTIEANTLTDSLLVQSQSLAEELRAQQEELRASNADLGRQASLLAEQNAEAKERNEELEESKRLVEEKAGLLLLSSTYKSEFIANMSHELRTPLNSLLMLAEQLENNADANMTPTQVEYASVIRSSGNDLLVLLNGILDLAKVESGTVELSVSEVSVEHVCSTLRSEFVQVARGRGLDFSIEVDSGTPDVIVTDLQRLRQIMKNLLANAFKFTAHGSVHVRAGIAADGWSSEATSLAAAGSVMALSVTDTGIGIEPEQQRRVFEAFSQGDGSSARLYGGTGLGLSISRQLAGLLGGEITVDSTPGEGSTFTVYLPVGAPAAVPAPSGPGLPVLAEPAATPTPTAMPVPVRTPMPSPAAEAVLAAPVAADRSTPPAPETRRSAPETRGSGDAVSLSVVQPGGEPFVPAVQLDDPGPEPDIYGGVIDGVTVLIVDDDFRNLFALTALLERAHARVVTAESGADALDVLDRDHGIDLILMDIMMPIMDGYATVRAIRAIDRLRDLPIIAVTGKVVKGERQRCLDAGANDYIPKPVNTADLLSALTPWLERVTGS